MEPYLTEEFANASTAYEIGRRARSVVEDAREKIAACIGAMPQEIFFTSGGSESDNWVIKSIAGAKKSLGKHIITSKIEHHAVLRSCEYLEKLGYEVTYLDVNDEGEVELDDFRKAIRQDTTLVTIMYGNNEIGTIEPVYEIGKIAREKGIFFHTDAVQAVGQLPIVVSRMPVDAMSASAHKFHGPKGVGFLYVKDEDALPSFIHGGGQERGKRAGTENVAGIVGMAKALELSGRRTIQKRNAIMHMRDYFIERIQRECEGVRINGHRYHRLPGNINVSFRDVEATPLLILLEEQGICASAGSACSTGETRVSHVLQAIGVPKEYAPGSIRLTIGEENTKEELDWTIAKIKESLFLLRQI